MAASNQKPILYDADLAERWGVTPRTLNNRKRAGQLPLYFPIGRARAYRLEDVRAHERKHNIVPRNDAALKPTGSVLTEQGLAKRWEVSVRSIQDMRRAGNGPKPFKLSKDRTWRYRLADVKAYEAAQAHQDHTGGAT